MNIENTLNSNTFENSDLTREVTALMHKVMDSGDGELIRKYFNAKSSLRDEIDVALAEAGFETRQKQLSSEWLELNGATPFEVDFESDKEAQRIIQDMVREFVDSFEA